MLKQQDRLHLHSIALFTYNNKVHLAWFTLFSLFVLTCKNQKRKAYGTVTSGQSGASWFPQLRTSDDGRHEPKAQNVWMLLEHQDGASRQHPDEVQTGERRRLEGPCGAADVHGCSGLLHSTDRKLQWFIFLTHLKLQRAFTSTPSNCLGHNLLDQLVYRCCRARRGVHGHCKPAPSRPLCSFLSHQPAAPSFWEGISTKAFREDLPGLGVKAGRWATETDSVSKMFLLHRGDAKHPAGFAAWPSQNPSGWRTLTNDKRR